MFSVDISNYKPDHEQLCKKLIFEQEVLRRNDHVVKCEEAGRIGHLFCLENFSKLKLPNEFIPIPNTKRIKVVKLDPPYCANSNNMPNDPKLNKNAILHRIKATCIKNSDKCWIINEAFDNDFNIGDKKLSDFVCNYTAEQKKEKKHLESAQKLTDLTNKFANSKFNLDRNKERKQATSNEDDAKNLSTSENRENNNENELVRNNVRKVQHSSSAGLTKSSSKNDLANEALVNTVNKTSIKGPLQLKRSATFTETIKYSAKSQNIVLKLSKYEKFERHQWQQQQQQLQQHLKQQQQQLQYHLQQESILNELNRAPQLAKPVIKIKRGNSESSRKAIVISYSREGNYTPQKQLKACDNIVKEENSDETNDDEPTKSAEQRIKTARSKQSNSSKLTNPPKYVLYTSNNSTVPQSSVQIKNSSIPNLSNDETTYSPLFKQQSQQQVSLTPSISRSLSSYGFDVSNCKSVVTETKQIFGVNGRRVKIKEQQQKIPKISFEVTSPNPHSSLNVRKYILQN